MGVTDTGTNFFQRWCKEGRYYHLNWRSKFIVLAISIVLVVAMVLNLQVRETVEILTERIDIGGRFYVSPGRVRVNLGDGPETVRMVVKNRGEGADTYSISLMTPMGLTDGYEMWDGGYSINFPESIRVGSEGLVAFDVTLTRNGMSGKQEVWLLVKESDIEWIVQSLAVRILVNG